MPGVGANIQPGNASFISKFLYRKMGWKPKNRANFFGPVGLRNMATDAGTTFPRRTALLAKYSATAPTSNTAADCPTGVGDICIHFLDTGGAMSITDANIDIYRCSAYTNTTTFTWTKIVD